MARNKISITNSERFRIKNEERIEKSFRIKEENMGRPKSIHHKTFKSATLRQIFKEKFMLTRNEIEKLIYQVLSEHPEGLSFKQLQFFTGLGPSTTRKSLNILRDRLISGHRGIFIRRITPFIALYYTDKHSRKIAKQIMETEEKYMELEKKIKEMENGK